MIRAEELRIGNWVNVSNNISTVMSVRFSGIHVMGNAIVNRPDEVEPIPITPEILERCGFVKSSEFDSYHLNQFDIEFVFGRWNWVVDDRGDNEGTKPRKIDSLHQLQNLFFALTGTELEYNPVSHLSEGERGD